MLQDTVSSLYCDGTVKCTSLLLKTTKVRVQIVGLDQGEWDQWLSFQLYRGQSFSCAPFLAFQMPLKLVLKGARLASCASLSVTQTNHLQEDLQSQGELQASWKSFWKGNGLRFNSRLSKGYKLLQLQLAFKYLAFMLMGLFHTCVWKGVETVPIARFLWHSYLCACDDITKDQSEEKSCACNCTEILLLKLKRMETPFPFRWCNSKMRVLSTQSRWQLHV